MRITCLHTAASNIDVFEAAATALGIAPGVLHHEVRPDLLAAAEHLGYLSDDVAGTTAEVLLALARHADAVVLTCSTLGPSLDTIPHPTPAPILRADEALAVEAAQAGARVVVLCAVATTLEPTSTLFHRVAQRTGATVDVHLVAGAWDLFKAGDLQGYLCSIAKAADRAYLDGASIVALGQASMGGAAQLVSAGPPALASASAGLKAALNAIRG
ncbi:aspartate/glutamate racemase family protein [Pseudomonas sp. P7548]|uniref:aspartate/glutamate racemase family protein n=1 Tax=Pseudomonas sp. P7548 TaxID=2726981 RepID=UPI0015B98DF3|nr:aspartate/glutamate racemase family protein [Pseudomonas sp. P7548]NWE23469.1 Asp/Glu racemase [Pseudomonas sp. P7548]